MSPLEKFDPDSRDGDLTPPTSAPNDGERAAPVDWRERIGRYRIVQLLGRGGMGSVYLAHDTQLDRDVALKIPHFGAQQADVMERFFREARAAGRLRHPNICPVYDVGEADGVHYLCLEYVQGQTLAEHVRDLATRPPRDAAALVRKIALALVEAHAKGVIHRDLKPSNVMIDLKGEPVVMDFGLAREVHAGSASDTQAGVVMGTPTYMSPEQARGDVAAVSPACDVYSLGVVLYELLTGRVPFVGHVMDVLMQQVRDEPPAPTALRPDLDAHVEAICLKAMEKEPSRRFLSMAEFADALDAYARGVTPPLEAETDPLERLAAEALLLFRACGWEAGMAKLRGRVSGEAPDKARLLAAWLQGETLSDESLARVRGLRRAAPLEGWGLLGRGWHANVRHDFAGADVLLRQAADVAHQGDVILQAEIARERGYWSYQAGRLGEALSLLHAALGRCGRDHFLTAGVLAIMGVVYANKNNFQAAQELLRQALLAHERFNSDRVTARCLRLLGELYLDWDYLEKAEEVFQRGLQRGMKTQDGRVQAVMFHYLGRVALGKAQRLTAAAKKAQARQELARAGELLDAALRGQEQAARGQSGQAAAHRDRALVCLAQDDAAGCAAHAERAEQMFRDHNNEEGVARVWLVQGMLARRQGRNDDAQKLLRQALAHFDHIADYLEAARTQLEIARTLAEDAGAIGQVVTTAYLDALNRAEGCRRSHLVRAVEDELQALDPQAYWKQVFGRLRGRSALTDTASLAEGVSEVVSVVFLNLQNFMVFCQGMEPEEVMQTLNHVLADLAEPLRQADAQVTAHLGGGFMALCRGQGHAWRAVDAALGLIAVVEEFNRPRAVLGLPQLPVRVAVASGPACLGNVGTFQKMDFTAVGNAVNLAARLVRQARSNALCVSRETRQLVGERFSFEAASPRVLELGTLGRHEVWDVTGRRQGLMSHGGA